MKPNYNMERLLQCKQKSVWLFCFTWAAWRNRYYALTSPSAMFMQTFFPDVIIGEVHAIWLPLSISRRRSQFFAYDNIGSKITALRGHDRDAVNTIAKHEYSKREITCHDTTPLLGPPRVFERRAACQTLLDIRGFSWTNKRLLSRTLSSLCAIRVWGPFFTKTLQKEREEKKEIRAIFA